MNTNETTTPNNTAAPSVTIAPRNPAKGVLLFVVTLTTHQTVRSYPCRSIDKATSPARRGFSLHAIPLARRTGEGGAVSAG